MTIDNEELIKVPSDYLHYVTLKIIKSEEKGENPYLDNPVRHLSWDWDLNRDWTSMMRLGGFEFRV